MNSNLQVNSESAYLFGKPISSSNEISKKHANSTVQYNPTLKQQTQKTVRNIRPINIKKLKKIGLGKTDKNANVKSGPQTAEQIVTTTAAQDMTSTNVLSQILSTPSHLTESTKNHYKPKSALSENSKHNQNLQYSQDRLAHAKSVLSKMLLNKKQIAERLQKKYDNSSASPYAEINEKFVGDVTSTELKSCAGKSAYTPKQLNEKDPPKVLNFQLSRAPNMAGGKNLTVIKKCKDFRNHALKKREKPVTFLQNCVESINDFVKQTTQKLNEKESTDKVSSITSIQSASIVAPTKTDTVGKVDGKCIRKSRAGIESTTNMKLIQPNTANLNLSEESTDCIRSGFLIKLQPNIQSTETHSDVPVPDTVSVPIIHFNPIVIEDKILSQDEKIDLTTLVFDNANTVTSASTVTTQLRNVTSLAPSKKECTSSKEHIGKLSTIIIPPGMCLDKNVDKSKKLLFKKKGYKNVSFEPIIHQIGGTDKVVQPVRFKVRSGKISDLAKTLESSIGILSEESEVICTYKNSTKTKDCLEITNSNNAPKHISEINVNEESSIESKSGKGELFQNHNVTAITAVDEILNSRQLNLASENVSEFPMTSRISSSSSEAKKEVGGDQNKEDGEDCMSAVEYIANLFKEHLPDGQTPALTMDNDENAVDTMNSFSTSMKSTSNTFEIAGNDFLASAGMKNVNNKIDFAKASENAIQLTNTDSADQKNADAKYIKLDTSDMTCEEAALVADTNCNVQIGSIVKINSANLQNVHIFSQDDEHAVTIKRLTESQNEFTEGHTDTAKSISEEITSLSNFENSKHMEKLIEPIIITETVQAFGDVLADVNIPDSLNTPVQVHRKKGEFHSVQNRNTEKTSSLPLKSILKTSSSKKSLNVSIAASETLNLDNIPVMKQIALSINKSNIPDENIIETKLHCSERNQYARHLRKTKVNLVQRRKLPQKQQYSKTNTSQIFNGEEVVKIKHKQPIFASEMLGLNDFKGCDVLATQSAIGEISSDSKELIDSVVLFKTQSALEMFAEACERHVSEPVQVSFEEQIKSTVPLPELVPGQTAMLVQHFKKEEEAKHFEVLDKESSFVEKDQCINVLETDNSNPFKNGKEINEKGSCSQSGQTGVVFENRKKKNEMTMDEDLKNENMNKMQGISNTVTQEQAGINTNQIEYTLEKRKNKKREYHNVVSTAFPLSKRIRMDSDVNKSIIRASNDDYDMNVNYETPNNESSQECLVKTNRKRLRKTVDVIKKTRSVTFASESDSDNVDGELQCNNISNEFCGFYEQEGEMRDTPAETIVDVMQDKKLKVPSTNNSYEHSEEILNKLKVRILQPFITRASISRSIPLKKRWDLGRKPHEETDITDDTSPADDEDDEGVRKMKHSSDLSEVCTSHNVCIVNTQEASKSMFPKICMKASSISLKKSYATLPNKLSIPETSSLYLCEPISNSAIDINFQDVNISTENDVKFDTKNVSRRNTNLEISKLICYDKCDLVTDITEASTDDVVQNQDEVSLQTQERTGRPNRQLSIKKSSYHSKMQKPFLSLVTPQKHKRGRPRRALASLEDCKMDIGKCLRSKNSMQEEKLDKDKKIVHQPTNCHLKGSKETKKEINPKRCRGRPKHDNRNCRQNIGDEVYSEKSLKGQSIDSLEGNDAKETSDEELLEDQPIQIKYKTRQTADLKCPIAKDNENLKKSRGRPKRLSRSNKDEIKEISQQQTKMFEPQCDPIPLDKDLNTSDNSRAVLALQKSDCIANLDPLNLLQKKGNRGRKPAMSHFLNAVGKEQNATTVPTFNSRLLLIRSRSQLDTNESLTEDSQNVNSKGKLKCGLCLALVQSGMWTDHLAEHYGVGWINGKTAINVNERSIVLATIINYMKANPTKVLTCRMCPKQYRSALGILQHIELCGAMPQRIPCEFCGKTYSKLSLPVHQRVCCERSKGNERSTDMIETEVNYNEDLFNNSGRLKRISSRKAESKLKSLIEENKNPNDLDFNFMKFVKYFAPVDINKYRCKWDDDLQNISVARCPFRICKYRSSLVNNLEEHIKTCKYQIRPGFHCKLCKKKMIFQTDAEASLHVQEKHHTRQDSCSENDEDDFSDVLEDENFSSESDISSGVESDETDEENQKISGRQNKRSPPILNNKLYTPRKNNVWCTVKNKWTEFINRHYIISSLYGFLIPNYIKAHSEIISQFQDIIMSPMKFAFDENFSFKNAKYNSRQETNSLVNWSISKRFQTIKFQDDSFIFVGGSVKTVRWVPLPKHVKEQFLAVLYREDMDDYTHLLEPTKKSSFILLFKIQTTNTSIESELHYVIHIPEGPVHDIAFMPSGGYDETKNRLALLAVGTAFSSINIFSVPIKLNGNEFSGPGKTNVIELRVGYVLCLELTDKIVRSQCTIIRWSELMLHNFIFASFANGFVGIWDISEEDNLNRSESNNERIYYVPLSFFYVGEKTIIAFDVHYDTSGPRWIGMITASRRFIVYDIRDMTQPIILNLENCKTSIISMDWPPIWDMIPVGYCDTMQCGRSVIAMNPLNLIYHNIKIDNTLSGVSSIHYTPLQNILVCGTDNGDVIFLNPRECHFEDILSSSMKNTRAVAMLKIQLLNGNPLKALVPIEADVEVRNDNCQMFDDEYVEKYGLIFGSTFKYQPGDRDDYYNIQRKPNFNLNRYLRITSTRFNMNINSECLVGIGYENGFIRIMDFKRRSYFD